MKHSLDDGDLIANKIWIGIAKNLLQRLLISTSYSAVAQIQKSLLYLPAYSSRDLFALISLCVFSAVAISLKGSNHGFKGVFSMLAARSLTSTFPIPKEQNNRLVLPGILLYFSSITTLIWAMLIFVKQICGNYSNKDKANEEGVMETLKTIIDYMVLFAASRGLARFKATSQMHTLGILSMVFLLFPRSKSDQNSKLTWFQHFLDVIECLAVRGAILWITSGIQSFTGVSGPLPIVLLNWALLVWNPFTLTNQLAACGSVLSLMSAQQSAELLQVYVHSSVSASLFLVSLSWLIHWSVCPHPVCSVCSLGVSIAATSWLEKWVLNITLWNERFFVYAVVFILLEYLLRTCDKAQFQHQQPILIIMGAEQQAAEGDDGDQTILSNMMGIAHAETILGLPKVLDSNGKV
jgi:hypothetical protein